MSVVIQDNFNTAASKPIDSRFGPYNNTTAATTSIPENYRYIGLTVGIGNPVVEYWWKNGTGDGDLVVKQTGGNVQSITQGTGIIVTGTTTPTVEIDTTVVQQVSNISLDVPTDGGSDVKYPSVKATKTYVDGLVVGLLNDRGNWPGGASSPGAYPTINGSGPAGAILKGDIWFINVDGYLGTTYVTIGASVRALEDAPGQDSTKWDILDAGLGFIPENSANKVSTGANVNADPTNIIKYPSVKALVEYVQTYSPAPTVPTLQQVTNAGAVTTLPISANNLYIKDGSGSLSDYWNIQVNTELFITNNLGIDLVQILNSGGIYLQNGSTGYYAYLDVSSLSSTQSYTFPNATGTLALTSDIPTVSGTIDYIPKFTSSSAVGDSIMYQTTVGSNTYVRVGAGSGDMAFPYETLILERPADTKFGVYNSQSSFGIGGASYVLGNTKATTASSYYPGFEFQFIGALSSNDNYIRYNFLSRDNAGNVQKVVNNLLNIYGDGRVIINPNFASKPGDLTPNLSVGIGTSSPNSSAILDITSTTKGFLPPRMTTAEMNAISSPQIGLMIFNTDTGYMTVYRGPSFTPEWWRLQYVCEDC